MQKVHILIQEEDNKIRRQLFYNCVPATKFDESYLESPDLYYAKIFENLQYRSRDPDHLAALRQMALVLQPLSPNNDTMELMHGTSEVTASNKQLGILPDSSCQTEERAEIGEVRGENIPDAVPESGAAGSSWAWWTYPFSYFASIGVKHGNDEQKQNS